MNDEHRKAGHKKDDHFIISTFFTLMDIYPGKPPHFYVSKTSAHCGISGKDVLESLSEDRKRIIQKSKEANT